MKQLPILTLLVAFTLNTATLPAQSYEKEKIYIQTDHVFYKPGETIFFKTWLVKGSDNKLSTISNIVSVEILGPSGTTLLKQLYELHDGYGEGSYTLNDQAPGGIHKIRAYTTWMQNEKDSSFFTKSITVQSIIAPRVLMKLDFPKKGYGPGDEVTADFSMRNLDDAPIKNHPGVFTISLDGQTTTKAAFTTNADGKAGISFPLPKDLHTTDGLLNITVDYDANTESIARSIPITLNKIDLQFLPEGGSLVATLPANLAFKAINEFGKPVDVKGVIRDDKDQLVASFESYKFGMGEFPFTPRPGITYTATITSPAKIARRYPLPKAAPEGVTMTLTKTGGTITIKCNATSGRTVRIVGSSKNKDYYSENTQLKKGENSITLAEDRFPAGITQFTLYDAENKPLAERLVFLNAARQLHVTISTNKQHYLPREKVIMTITTRDEHGRPVPSNFALSVVDDKLWTMADDRQDNILSWLLMSSELNGPIEEPPFYFKKDEPKASRALDLVMLTNGYRYFDFIDEVIRNKELKYSPDQSNVISGLVIDEKDKPVPATVFLLNNNGGGKALKQLTGSNGQFYFPNLIEGGSYLLIARSLHKSAPIRIEFQKNAGPHIPIPSPVPALSPIPGVSPAPAIPHQPKIVNLGIRLNDRSKALNEVVVIGYGTMRRRDMVGSVATVDGDVLRAVPPTGVLQALAGNVPGLDITPAANPGGTPLIRIRGARTFNADHQPLIVVDGIPQEKYDLNNINVYDIESVTVLKDAAAIAIFGARAANGVISIQTKTLRNEKLRFNITKRTEYSSRSFNLTGPVFTIARRFYSPRYKSTVTDERNDYRETIYWNPIVQTDSTGKAAVEFYNSDATTTFRAIAEGIGNNGMLGRGDTTYAARSAISVDAKIPPYLTVGDQAQIPLVIRNSSAEKLDASIDIIPPFNMQTGNFDKTVTLNPNESRQILIPLSATAPTDGKITINITSNLSNEKIVLPISATGKGFPVIETFSGNTSATHDLKIGQILPGSLTAKLTLYKDLEGELLSGIESMLREPSGCFEQTSSTTYPNVFILKYLRESGKSNPAIEKKALRYIENGYRKLIGFETAENGFEWFGHSPAHTALTAYGLLEFTDMQEFLDVDHKMLQRTKDFLLKRRDGQGGFGISTSGYDQFAAVPNKIANIYIVYALTKAGYGNEIKSEYAAAVNKAMESNDSYQLAMMALAASNMKNEGDYRRLMNLLKTNSKLSAETSVVNSRDISLRVETMALYALALMRDSHPDLGTAADMISKILANRSYYGYGSTQGTVLALEAVTEYTKRTGEQTRSTDIRFTVNGRTVTPEDSIAAFLHPGQNTLSADYPDKDRGIPYNLEVSYQTLTPPNSEKADLKLNTTLSNPQPHVGETVRLTIAVNNRKDTLQPMAIAKIGIPAGLSLQPWQLKEITEKKQVAYYEIFDNYLVLYWMGFAPSETKTIQLDLKAEIPGKYKGKASNVYLYYTPEAKHWNEGLEVEVYADPTPAL